MNKFNDTIEDEMFVVFTPSERAGYCDTLKANDYVIPTIGIVAMVSNLIVIVSSGLIMKQGQVPKTTYILLGNVALADFFTAFSTVFARLYPRPPEPRLLCMIELNLIVASTLASVYTVGLIAVDRYLYIVHGLKYQAWVYPLRVRFAVCFVWLLGLLVGFLPLMGWNEVDNNGDECWFISITPTNLVLLTVGIAAIPLVIVLVLYSLILYQALQTIHRLERAPKPGVIATPTTATTLRVFVGNQHQQQQQQRIDYGPKRRRAIMVVALTSGGFLFTWGPYFVAATIYVLSDNLRLVETLSILISSPLIILGFCNTLINPLIYAWWHRGFRQFVTKQWRRIRCTCCCCCCCCSRHRTCESNETPSTTSPMGSEHNA